MKQTWQTWRRACRLNLAVFFVLCMVSLAVHMLVLLLPWPITEPDSADSTRTTHRVRLYKLPPIVKEVEDKIEAPPQLPPAKAKRQSSSTQPPRKQVPMLPRRVPKADADEPSAEAAAIDLFPNDILWSAAQQLDAGPDSTGLPGIESTRRMIEQEEARRRVRDGLIDPYFTKMNREFERHFQPSWEQLHSQSSGAIRSWLNSYLATAKRYGGTGSPYREGERDYTLARRRNLPGEEGLRDDFTLDLAQGRAGGSEIATVIEVIQAPTGELLGVKVVTGSGVDAYDEEVRMSVVAALKLMEPPERADTGLGLRGDNIISYWKHRTRFGRFPLAPVWGCELYADFSIGKCFYPTKRLVHPHIELLSVDEPSPTKQLIEDEMP